MPIWDRPYMQGPSPTVPLKVRMRAWSVTKWLIVINVVAFLAQAVSARTFLGQFIAGWLYNHPDHVVTSGCLWQPLTSAFLHGGVWHILWNMLFLYWFGSELERIYGRKDFLAFYLEACYVGGLAYALGAYFYTGAQLVPDSRGELVMGYLPSLGASSGVMGVVVLYAFFYPHRRIWVYFIFPVKIWIAALLFVAADLFGFVGGAQTGVANAAHLGGALVAVLYRYVDVRWSALTQRLGTWLPSWRTTGRPRSRASRPGSPRLHVHPNVGPVIDVPPGSTRHPPDDPSPVTDDDMRRMDELLERINARGMGALSPTERDFLARISRKLRNRP